MIGDLEMLAHVNLNICHLVGQYVVGLTSDGFGSK